RLTLGAFHHTVSPPQPRREPGNGDRILDAAAAEQLPTWTGKLTLPRRSANSREQLLEGPARSRRAASRTATPPRSAPDPRGQAAGPGCSSTSLRRRARLPE